MNTTLSWRLKILGVKDTYVALIKMGLFVSGAIESPGKHPAANVASPDLGLALVAVETFSVLVVASVELVRQGGVDIGFVARPRLRKDGVDVGGRSKGGRSIVVGARRHARPRIGPGDGGKGGEDAFIAVGEAEPTARGG